MNLTTIGFSLGFFLITAVTFAIWMRAPTKGDAGFFPLLASLSAFLFFLACFAFGVWFSLLRVRGLKWWL